MLEAQGSYVKLAVDLGRRILAGGGEMHADCEAVLLDDGSEQDHVWGADWYPDDQTVGFDSFINIRPRQGNRSMTVQDASRRRAIEEIVRERMSS
jgi:hypothetical protein